MGGFFNESEGAKPPLNTPLGLANIQTEQRFRSVSALSTAMGLTCSPDTVVVHVQKLSGRHDRFSLSTQITECGLKIILYAQKVLVVSVRFSLAVHYSLIVY